MNTSFEAIRTIDFGYQRSIIDQVHAAQGGDGPRAYFTMRATDTQQTGFTGSIELTPTQHTRTIRAIIIQSVLGTISGASLGGLFYTAFALKIGVTNLQMGVISTVSLIASSMQIFSPFILERVGSRKKMAIVGSVLSVSMYWLLVAIPFVIGPALPNIWRVYALWSVIGLATFFGALVGPGVTSWRSDIIPERQRGRFFAKISIAPTIVGFIVQVVEAAYLDEVKTLAGFSAIFIIGVIFGYASVAAYIQQTDLPMARVERSNPLRLFLTVFSHRPFMNILLFNLIWSVVASLTGPFATVFMINEVHIRYAYIALLGNAAGLVSLLGMPVWGFLIDMYGSRSVMKIAYFWSAFSTVLWALITRGNWWVMLPIMYAVGGFVGAAGWGMTNLTWKNAPRENQSAYFAVMGATISIFAAFAPSLGGALLDLMKKTNFDPIGIGPYRMLFGGVGLMLMGCLALLRLIQEPEREVSTTQVITQAWSWNPIAVAVHLLRLSRRVHQQKRVRAAAALGDLKSRLATSELFRALNDPSPLVRREAARSLGEIGDEHAVRHLIGALKHPFTEVRQEAALALGKAKVPVDLEPLIDLLNDPDPLVQSSAAIALGEIGDKRAEAALLSLLNTSTDATVRSSAARAIAALGREEDIRSHLRKEERAAAAPGVLRSKSAVDRLARSLDHPSPRVRREVVRSLGEIGDKQAIRHLVSALDHPFTEVRQEAALALGKARAPIDLDTLLKLLQESEPLVQSSAAVALGEIGDQRAAEPLLSLLESSTDGTVRASVASAIASLGRKEDVRLLLVALEREEEEAVRQQIILAIGTLMGGAEFYSLAGTQEADQEKAIYRILESDRRTALSGHRFLGHVKEQVEAIVERTLELYEEDAMNAAVREVHRASQIVLGAITAACPFIAIQWPGNWSWDPARVPPEAMGVIATASVIEFVSQRAAAADEKGKQLARDEFVLGVYAYRRLLTQGVALAEKSKGRIR